MGKIIGVDFGTTNTIITEYEDGNLREFVSADQRAYVKSAIIFDKEEVHIGEDAVIGSNTKYLHRYFKMFLNIPNQYYEDCESAGWNPIDGKSAYEVTAAYLKERLNSNSRNSFVQSTGEKIDTIALTIPASWINDPENSGHANLKNILTKELGFPQGSIILVSEPQAAAAYYIWEQKKKGINFKGNLLVCDMGGGTFDVSLVYANYNNSKVEVLYNTGSGRASLGEAGVNYDKAVAEEIFRQDQGVELYDTHPTAEANLFIDTFEKRKIYNFSNLKGATRRFEDEIKANKYNNKYNLFTFSVASLGYKEEDIEVDSQTLIEVFKKNIEPSIKKVLQKVNDYIKREKQEINQILIVGGFGTYILVQKTILDFFGLDFKSPKFVNFKGQNQNYYAIARGAALVAAKEIDLREKMPYEMGITAYPLGNSTKGVDFALILKNQVIEDNPKPIWLKKEFVLTDNALIYEFYIKKEGRLPIRFNRKHKQNDIPTGKHYDYKLGMYVDKNKIIYLVFEDENGKRYTVMFSDIIISNDTIYFRED